MRLLFVLAAASLVQAAQEQRAAPPAPPVAQAEQPERKTHNSPACSPKPVRVDSRPHLYIGPSTFSTPIRTVYVKPEYPESAMAAKVQGIVVLEAQIELDGHVCNPRILRSIPLLDQSAINAVRQWRYTPAKRNGVAVPVVTTLTVNFTLQ